MKQFFPGLLGVCLLLGIPAQAQTGPDPVRQKLDAIFAPLDKSQVPTGRLLEYATPIASLPSFDGAVLRDSGRADMSNFRHLYAMVQSGRISGADTLPTIATLNQRLLAAAPPAAGGTIPVAVQYITYARLRPDAETAGLVSIQNEQLYDVAGRTQSPYQTAVLFAAAPERSFSASRTVALKLPRNLYLASGTPGSSIRVYLDFGDGNGYRLTTWNQTLSTTYTSDGAKRVRVKLVYSLSLVGDPAAQSTHGATTQAAPGPRTDTRESWFDLTVADPTATFAARYNASAHFDTTFAPTIAYSPLLNFSTDYVHHLGAKVNVYFGQGHTRIVKPFIVVEGYNTSAIAPHLVGKNNMDNTVQDFLDNEAV